MEWLLASARNFRKYGTHSCWYGWISTNKNRPSELIILQELMATYDDEEKGNITQGMVVTTFDAYSTFVEAMVKKTKTIVPDNKTQIYAVTSLALPVVQWQNYGRISNAEREALEAQGHKTYPYQFNKSVDKWDKYLHFLTKTFAQSDFESGPHKVAPTLLRYIISFDNDVIKHLQKKGSGWPLELYRQRSYNQSLEMLHSWILCDSGGSPTTVLAKEAPELLKVVGWASGYSDIITSFYGVNTDQDGRAYIIVPSNALTDPTVAPTKDRQWRKYGTVFSEYYQDNSRHLLLYTCDLLAFKDHYEPSSKWRTPQDFFMVGYGPPLLEPPDVFNSAKVQWIFGLSAVDADEKLDKIRLSFFSPAWPTGRDQFAHIIDFCRDFASKQKGTVPERPQLGSQQVRELV